MTKSRDSSEALDVNELHELTDLDSGLRPAFAPGGVKPPPIPRAARVPTMQEILESAPAVDPDEYEGATVKAFEAPVAPSERLDMDDLVADLSTRPPPRIPSGIWEIPTIGPAKRTSAKLAAPRKRFSILGLAGAAIVGYALGFGTPALLKLAESRPSAPQVVAVAAAPIEAASAATPEPIAAPIELPAPAASIAAVAPAPEPAAPVIARAEPVAPPAEPETAVVAEPEAVAAEPSQPEPVASDLPEAPSREAVQAAIAGARPAIESCGDPSTRGDQARVTFTFASEGRTAHALVEGVTGPTASCIARAARGVRVPAFSRDRFVVAFPFQL